MLLIQLITSSKLSGPSFSFGLKPKRAHGAVVFGEFMLLIVVWFLLIWYWSYKQHSPNNTVFMWDMPILFGFYVRLELGLGFLPEFACSWSALEPTSQGLCRDAPTKEKPTYLIQRKTFKHYERFGYRQVFGCVEILESQPLITLTK